MINQAVITGVLWGTLLGLFYFGGLWFTARLVPAVKYPKRLLLFSFILRLTVAMSCFWLVLQEGPLIFGAMLLFFFLVRLVMTRWSSNGVREGSHAN